MKIGQVLGVAGLAAGMTLGSYSAHAFDLNGAWATDVAACGKLFQKSKDGALSLAEGADMYGNGFVVRNDVIIGNNATCKILSHKIAGPVSHLVAKCAAENVAFSTFQFSYRINDENSITRIYPGVEELNVNYGRCTL